MKVLKQLAEVRLAQARMERARHEVGEPAAALLARGFLLGAAVATRLGIGVLAVRKGGKLPPPVHSV
ncbi:MAG: hypothetical protein WBA47_12025, partial [Rhodanobacter sp.]